jgi:hypothetical protein
MSSKKLFIAVFNVVYISIQAQDYVYPVVACNDSSILCIYQHGQDKLELYEWDIQTNMLHKIVSSVYTPASVKLLTDGSGFSFVDNGRIRLKRFHLRAVKTIDIYEPLYGIELIEWLDSTTCYFHALADGHYGLYMLTIYEELTLLLKSECMDLMYPSIIHDTLWYIEIKDNTDGRKARVMMRPLDATESQLVYDFGAANIMFLSMHSGSDGFLIDCNYVDNDIFIVTYWHIFQDQYIWHTEQLFTFTVHAQFLINPSTRLYESIVPFIPRWYQNMIYYSSSLRGIQSLYCFDMKERKEHLVRTESRHVFSPVYFQNSLVYGSFGDTYEEIIKNIAN